MWEGEIRQGRLSWSLSGRLTTICMSTRINRNKTVAASNLYLDHFQLTAPPFEQEADMRFFFPAAGRETLLNNLLAEIESGKPFVKLAGREGVGKTLLCRILEQNINPDRFRLVSLEHPVGSYENLLRTVCLALGAAEGKNDGEPEVSPDYLGLFRNRLRQIEAEGKRFVLLIDEAEQLFLATLERLLRLLCLPEWNRTLQLLLVGRLELDEHLEQLTVYCSGLDIETGYVLEGLSLEETRQYIHFRLQVAGVQGEKYLDLFTDDAVEMIFQAAMGNISLTNSLAEHGLKKAAEQGKFQVEEDLILDPQSVEENVSLAFFQGYDFVRDNKWWLLIGAIAVWGILMLFWPSGGKKELPPEAGDTKMEVLQPQQEIVMPSVPTGPSEPETENLSGQAGSSITTPDQEKTVKKEAPEPRQLTPRKEVGFPEAPVPMIKVQPLEEKNRAVVRKEPVIIAPEKRKKSVPVQVSSEKKSEVPAIIASTPEKDVRSPAKAIKRPAQAEDVPDRDGNAIFAERTRASATWISWAYRGGYTIQLMVLASETAEENLKRILVDDRYFALRDHLYILRKRTPRTFYLFYGNYESMENAREARNAMPKFLRENQPYVLSIRDALEKVE